MAYEAWRISYQSSEQAARAAYVEMERLRRALSDIRDYSGYQECGNCNDIYVMAQAALEPPYTITARGRELLEGK